MRPVYSGTWYFCSITHLIILIIDRKGLPPINWETESRNNFSAFTPAQNALHQLASSVEDKDVQFETAFSEKIPMKDLLVLLNHADKHWVDDHIVQKCINIWARFCPYPLAVLDVSANSTLEKGQKFIPTPQIWGVSSWVPSIPIVTVHNINDNHYVSIKVLVGKRRIVYVDPYRLTKSDPSEKKVIATIKSMY